MKSELSCFRSQPELQDYERALENVPSFEDMSQDAAVEDPHFHNFETTVCSQFQLLCDHRADFAPLRLTIDSSLSNVTRLMSLYSDPALSPAQTTLSLLRNPPAMAALITQFQFIIRSTSYPLQAFHINNNSIIIPCVLPPPDSTHLSPQLFRRNRQQL